MRDSDFAAKPGPRNNLALTLPIFLVYQLGVVFLNVRNATDVVTGQMLELSHHDRLTYLEMTAGVGLATAAVFAVLGRGQSLRPAKLLQIGVEGAAYAIAMGAATSWLVGKLFAGPAAAAVTGPFTGIVMSLGAGFTKSSRSASSFLGSGRACFSGRSGAAHGEESPLASGASFQRSCGPWPARRSSAESTIWARLETRSTRGRSWRALCWASRSPSSIPRADLPPPCGHTRSMTCGCSSFRLLLTRPSLAPRCTRAGDTSG